MRKSETSQFNKQAKRHLLTKAEGIIGGKQFQAATKQKQNKKLRSRVAIGFVATNQMTMLQEQNHVIRDKCGFNIGLTKQSLCVSICSGWMLVSESNSMQW